MLSQAWVIVVYILQACKSLRNTDRGHKHDGTRTKKEVTAIGISALKNELALRSTQFSDMVRANLLRQLDDLENAFALSKDHGPFNTCKPKADDALPVIWLSSTQPGK